MYRFEALDDVSSTLDRLSQRAPPLVAVLPRQPGTKESRYMHLLSSNAPPADALPPREHAISSSGNDRIAILENDVAELRKEIAEMQQQLASFRKQFE